MSYAVIDTGAKGAMILFDDLGVIDSLVFERMGQGINSFKVAEKLQEWRPQQIYVEQISARPNQSAVATFTQAFIVGQLHTLSQLHCDYVEYIYPQTWTSFTKRLSSKPNRPSKEIAQELAAKFYSKESEQYRSKRGKKLIHDGIADVLCINLYIRRDDYLDYLT